MRRNVVLCLLSAVFGGVLAAGLWNRPNPSDRVTAAEPPPTASRRLEPIGVPGNDPLPVAVRARPAIEDELTPEERVNVAVYENVNRSVVNITTKIPGTAGFLMFDNTEVGAGSGSVLDKQGHILTNYHVIEGAKEIEVTLFDGSQHDARLVGRDISSDVAVIQIDAPPEVLFPVFFGDSTRLKVGQRVFAIGNPFGFDRTLTTGIISSLDRTIPARNDRTIKSIIQIDAAINPGNSGGPLLDSHGRLIGMNTAIASRTGQNTGIGFAIPVNNISRVVPELIEKGHVVRPETGITRVYQTEHGLYVVTMATGGPAEQAGLRGFKVVKQVKRQGPFTYQTETVDRSSAELIIGVNGEKTLTRNDFLNAIEAHHPGEDVTLNVIREGRQIAVRLRLAAAES
jgi:S1-C subfamily serine protease